MKIKDEAVFSDEEMYRFYQEQENWQAIRTFEEVKDVIRARMAESEYDRIINNMIDSAYVKINDDVYYEIDNMIIR